ncbi:hypothetical protein CEPID_07780 [Corynebacterium epidermidicanis]|uniref:Uncharacterized protein n=1 Tax=Corynebacterium epidermidicanis TaxID=1050174 RepID=A0A0G3GQC2_9CORY|nr:hypothetical protein CEPID_07780 [Corynebacterium epidermidicanis]
MSLLCVFRSVVVLKSVFIVRWEPKPARCRHFGVVGLPLRDFIHEKTLLYVVGLRRSDDIALMQQTRTAGDTPTRHTYLYLTRAEC